jgi:BMFP domain-containing protein YqiC
VRTIRVFVAHAKSDPDDVIDRIQKKVSETICNAAKASGSDVEIKIFLGRDDFAENFKRCGSWDAWAEDVVNRIDFATRLVVYDAIVVTNQVIGAATQAIIRSALAAHRPILLFCNDSVLRPIRGVNRVSEDFKAGWEVIAS